MILYNLLTLDTRLYPVHLLNNSSDLAHKLLEEAAQVCFVDGRSWSSWYAALHGWMVQCRKIKKRFG